MNNVGLRWYEFRPAVGRTKQGHPFLCTVWYGPTGPSVSAVLVKVFLTRSLVNGGG